ncbi:MAG: formate/nitrite transporter family protein [Candidatus Saccharibacteria bacterium]|nr:formate/nitrite transporter family protein [Candidatus Saccharibacteria bacterium]
MTKGAKSPAEIADTAIVVGTAKAKLSWWKMLVLGVFAGMFIALAGVGATFGNIYGGKIAGACIFTAGLAMVVVAGSELFTGNNLMIMALFDRKITLSQMLKNWLLVFIGNLIGAIFVAAMVVISGLFEPIADTVIATATTKTNLGFFEATLRGILCNFLVCIAVWMAFSASTVSGKIIAVFLPIMLFVLCGFEHSIANSFFIPAGMITGEVYGLAAPGISDFLLGNLLPVTIGNIIGGTILVGGGYYLAYCTSRNKPSKVD